MKAEITLPDGKKFECNISKDNNKLTLSFEDKQTVPYSMIQNSYFRVNIKPTDEEIGCNGNCRTCLTPIC